MTRSSWPPLRAAKQFAVGGPELEPGEAADAKVPVDDVGPGDGIAAEDGAVESNDGEGGVVLAFAEVTCSICPAVVPA